MQSMHSYHTGTNKDECCLSQNTTDPHKADFLFTKKLHTSPLIVKPFNKAHTILLTDTRRLYELGFALMQMPGDSEKLSLIMCSSYSLTDTQANYATVELEAPAILYACQK